MNGTGRQPIPVPWATLRAVPTVVSSIQEG